MIRYSLRCDQGHDFESWFQSGDAFDGLMKRKLVDCPDCGSANVSKALMAPKVQGTKKSKTLAPDTSPTPAPPEPAVPQEVREKALAELRKQVEENSEYVGMNFASEARAIHEGEAPERAVYGEASPADARSLIEDGVPVAPLLFAPKRKMN